MSKYVNVDKLLGALEFMKDYCPEDEWDKGWNSAVKKVVDTVQKLETIEVKRETPELTEDEIAILKNVDIAFKWLVRDIDELLALNGAKRG